MSLINAGMWQQRVLWCSSSNNCLVRSFHATPSIFSKSSKRRKLARLREAPHLMAMDKANVGKKKTLPPEHALAHFDQFYGKTYGREWPSLRLAMLCSPKFCALVNNFSTLEKTRAKLAKMGCYNVNRVYQKQAQDFLQNYQMPASLKDDQEAIRSERQKRRAKEQSEEEAKFAGVVEETLESMPEKLATSRLIEPEEQVISAGSGAGADLQAASATIFDHVPSKKLIGMDDFVEESEYYSTYQKLIPQQPTAADRFSGAEVVPVQMSKMAPLARLPEHLDIWTFPAGSGQFRLSAPERDSAVGTHDYYCMDLASLLPVIMLDVQRGDSVLDLCSAPGGKSLAILQTLMPRRLVCNDNDTSRLLRVRRVMHAYFQSDTRDYVEGLVEFNRSDAATLGHHHQMAGQFERVLCDVECTTDRKALSATEGNWFSPAFKKLRLQLPESQSQILQSALKCVKVGGSVVYSTCSLSPVQNDGVVYDALKKIWSDTQMEFVVNDLSDAIEPFRGIMKLTSEVHNMRYGQMVLPHTPNNFGPMYFAKITRTD